jgi:hypothetical protein
MLVSSEWVRSLSLVRYTHCLNRIDCSISNGEEHTQKVQEEDIRGTPPKIGYPFRAFCYTTFSSYRLVSLRCRSMAHGLEVSMEREKTP